MVGGQRKARAVEAVSHQESFRRVSDRRAQELGVLPSTLSPWVIGSHTTATGDESLRKWASLLSHAAWYVWRKGSITEAVDLSEVAMKVRKKILGQEHRETSSSMAMIGLVYGSMSRWREAEKLQMQIIKPIKSVLGEEHPFTLTSIAMAPCLKIQEPRTLDGGGIAGPASY